MSYRGAVVARGKASAHRSVPRLLPVPARAGKRTVKVVGQFPAIRHGARPTVGSDEPRSARVSAPRWAWSRRSALVASGLVVQAQAPAVAAGCAGSTGVTVVVDFHELGGGVQQACDADGGGKVASTAVPGHRVPADLRAAPAGLRVPGRRQARRATRASTRRRPTRTGGCGGPTASPAPGATPASGVGSLKVPDGGYVAFSWQGRTARRRPGSHRARAPPPTPSPSPEPGEPATVAVPPAATVRPRGNGGGTATGGTGRRRPRRRRCRAERLRPARGPSDGREAAGPRPHAGDRGRTRSDEPVRRGPRRADGTCAGGLAAERWRADRPRGRRTPGGAGCRPGWRRSPSARCSPPPARSAAVRARRARP